MSADTNAIPKFGFVNAIHEGFPVASERYEACVEFYTRVLGLTQIPRPKALDEIGKGAWFTNDEKTIQFHLIVNDGAQKPGPDAGIEPAGRHTAWRISDAEAFRARMRALGQHFDELGGLIGQAQLFVKDPEGHTWEFQGPARQA
ncbi:MAG: hypothetical protein FJX29_01410 [Alphaproteobacteria bacterium]|nr:hypothetical protein [Alphaproteobacteria bacterium]